MNSYEFPPGIQQMGFECCSKQPSTELTECLNFKKKKQISQSVQVSPSGRVMIVCPTLPSFQPMSAAGLLRLSRRRARREDPSEAGSRRGQRRGGERGAPVGKNRETTGKSNWKASGRSGFRSAIVGFKSFGIIISAWHRIKNCGK